MNRDDVARAFGEELRAQRERFGISQEQMSLQAGTDRTYISQLERGVRERGL